MQSRIERPRALFALTLLLVLAMAALLFDSRLAVAEELSLEESNSEGSTSEGFEAGSFDAEAPEMPEIDVEGDPVWDGLLAPTDLNEISQRPAPEARGQVRKDAALMTGAVTSAFVDDSSSTVYAATRTAVPAQLFINDLESGATRTRTLSVGHGSWDMAKSGNTLAIGVSAARGADSTWVVGYDTATQSFTRNVKLKNAGIVMTVVEDTVNAQPGNGSYFWVGTYHSSGARLYRVNMTTGQAKDFTPGGSWRDYRYIRSLSADAHGVTIGLGNPASVWRIDKGLNKKPYRWQNADQAVKATSFAYSAAAYQPTAAPQPDSDAEPQSLSLIGTEAEARILLINNANGAVLGNHVVPGGSTVDRIAVDQTEGTAWFTTRPHGKLFSLNLALPADAPVERAQPVAGSETRALSMTSSPATVYGVTGVGEVWSAPTVDDVSQSVVVYDDIVKGSQEARDPAVQGVVQFGKHTLVGGHWRYQVHGHPTISSIKLPGEPKAQTVVGDKMYAALYPSASVQEIDSSFTVRPVADIGHGQMRPAAIEHHPELDILGVATGPAYGRYGGAISLVDPTGQGAPLTYTNPVGKHQVSAMVPYKSGFVVGTSTHGEAQPSRGRALIKYWTPSGNESAGTTSWSRTLPMNAQRVTGVQLVNDGAGEFVVAAVLVDGTATKRSEAWLIALDPSRKGAVLWKEKVGNLVTSLDESRGYITAQIDGRIQQLGITRSGYIAAPVKGISSRFTSAYSSLANRSGTQQTVAYASNGATGVAGSANQSTPRVSHRTAGNDRYLTAVEVSEQTYASADTVLLARGDDFADALTAGPLAAAMDAPILLVMHGNKLTPETQAEIKRLGATRAIPIGGTGAIPNSVRKALPSAVKLDTKNRPGGANRYETSVSVAKLLEKQLGKKVDVFATTGKDFADAIAAVPAAITTEKAIILYDHHRSAKGSAAFMSGRKVEALGGPASQALKSGRVKTAGSIVGSDRFDTARKVAVKYFRSTEVAYIAPGLSFPDGLTAGVSAGRDESPLLLSLRDDLTAPTRAAISAGYGSRKLFLIGGTGVLSTRLEGQLNGL